MPTYCKIYKYNELKFTKKIFYAICFTTIIVCVFYPASHIPNLS